MTTISLAEAFVDSDREFWRGVLTGGGFTPIPRWTLDPVPGVAGYEAAVPGDLLPALRQRAAELGVPLSSVLLAAHATVLAALSGESEVVTGYLAGAPRPAAAVPAGDRTRLVAGGPARGPPDRVGAAGSPGLPGRRSGGRARPDRAGLRDRV